ncbi:MAG: hypothetical protein IPN58_03555 [Anaerolineales bacterium]|nr:hypothetical protein [Anaerolineales bacterium]
MKIKNQITILVLFLAMLACAVPGVSQPAAPSNFDPASLPTLVVMTANAILSQTAAAVTPLPSETATPFPTATPTLAPTESVTATPRISQFGTSLILNDDQTVTFTDRPAGIEITIPAGWMPIRVNEQEYLDAYSNNAAADQAIRDRLTRIQTLDPAWFRLDIIDIQPGHVVNGAPTFMNVVFQQNETRSLEKIAKDESVKPYSDFKAISSNEQKAINGMDILVIEQKWSVTTGTTYYKGVFFKTASGLVVLDFYSPLEFKDTVLPDFEKVVNSLVLLNP